MATLRAPGLRDEGRLELPTAVRDALGGAQVKDAVRIEATRADEKPYKVANVDESSDVLEIEFEGGVRQFIRVDQFREDYGIQPSRDAANELVIPTRLGHSEPSRGIVSDLALKAFRVVGVPLEEKAANAVAVHFESKLDAGLHKWAVNGELDDGLISDANDIPVGKPLLVFLHGTASHTLGSFGALAEKQPGIWKALHGKNGYADRIFGFEHPSLSKSPIDNIVDLLTVLPPDATLHLVSHSRGGLLGELLCRALVRDAGDDPRDPFDEDDLRQFKRSDYDEQRAALMQLSELLREKRPRVERFVRVACPARGTVLASKRLDRFFSLLVNVVGATGLKASFLYDFVTSLAMATAKERTDPKTLPGIEAMIPDSPLVKVLNRADIRVPADLSVIAGDIQGSGVWNRLKIFATDLFYREDHDLVVNTRAMYGGTPRAAGSRFYFDKGSDVSHFNYFRNGDTADRLLAGLQRREGEDAGFEPFVVTEPPVVRRSARSGQPQGVVFVLPGIMGSHLAVGGNRIWLDPIDIARGRLGKLEMGNSGVEAQALVGRAYADLVEFLSERYDVIPFPYDWRRSLLEEGRRLGQALQEKLDQTPLRVGIVAHSMGGLLTRAMIAECGEVWEELKERGSRVVMLGTPNRGSFVINNVLLGRERLVRHLSRLDFKHDRQEVLDIIRRFQGLLELLPMDTQERDYFSPAAWTELHNAYGDDWLRPEDGDLKRAALLRKALDDERTVDPDHMSYVAGKAPATPFSIQINEDARGEERIRVMATAEGDGRVPWKSGLLPGVKTWYLDVAHGSLANHRPAFPGILDLLNNGDTQHLPTSPPVARESTQPFVMPTDDVVLYPDAEELEGSALGYEPEIERVETEQPVKVRITHGNLVFARHPVLLGHYEGGGILGAERVLDRQLEYRLSRRRQLDLYAGPIETTTVVLSGRSKPPGAIVAGLGTIGSLAPGDLCRTLAKGLVAYALEWVERNPDTSFQPLAVTSLLVGSGEGGVTLQDSVRAIIKAADDANRVLSRAALAERAQIAEVELLEIHLDRAVKASKILHQQYVDAKQPPHLSEWRVHEGRGGWRRIAYENDKDWWGRLRITERSEDGQLEFVAHTGRARAESYMLKTQRSSLDAFLRDAVQTTGSDEKLAHTLFELLVPNPIKDAAPQDRKTVLIVDKSSARYPWELMHDRTDDDAEPIAVRSGLVRQMQTRTFRETVVGAVTNSALVVGDPPTTKFVPLDGAKAEAEAVEKQLGEHGFQVKSAIQKPFREVFTKLFASPYRILHLAGHGVYEYPVEVDRAARVASDEPAEGSPSAKRQRKVTGMVLGDDVFLTPAEVEQMRHVPELVFINCCHLGLEEGNRRNGDKDRFHQLAANLGTQLIEMGARAVVAAGWAVQDDAAMCFAEKFYGEMLRGGTFGTAVQEARRATWREHRGANTWGAYQCYGDPDYVLVAGTHGAGDAEEPVYSVVDEAIAELEDIAANAKSASVDRLESLQGWVKSLDGELPADWKRNPRLLEALGAAYGEVRLFKQAVDCYQQAREAESASFSVKALEQLANLRGRWAVDLWNHARDTSAGQSDEPQEELPKPADVIESSLADIAILLAIGETRERHSLLGSAYKRQAWISSGAARDKALKAMSAAYEAAYQLGKTRDGAGLADYYPALNWLTARVLIRLRARTRKRFSDFGDRLDEVESAIEGGGVERSFWDAIALLDAQLVRRLHDADLHKDNHRATIARNYLRASELASAREFSSVLEHLKFLVEVLSEKPAKARTRETVRQRLHREVAALVEQLRSAGGE